ncbi:MAG: creatininase family protein [Candidatus Saliniplasma sp.]
MKKNELNSVWINELTWKDIDRYLEDKQIVIVPVGSTEQHGPGGPLGLDSYVAKALAQDAAKKTGVLVTPPLWFGDSSHHLDFPGTVSLSTNTLIEVIKDIVRSLSRNGFKKILLINGHKSANLAALETACKTVHEDELKDTMLAIADPMNISKGITSIKDTIEHHAGELEISQVWYKYPELIKEDELEGTEHIDLKKDLSPFTKEDLLGKNDETISVIWNSHEEKKMVPNGSFSDSTKASREKGKKYHDYMVDILVDFIDWMKDNESVVGKLG